MSEQDRSGKPGGKTVSDSRTVMTWIILPTDLNYHGTAYGGKVMQQMDNVATVASMRHSRRPVVTASVNGLTFHAPVREAEALELEAFVVWSHRSSMEVYVRAENENLLTGEKKLAATAHFVFVALDDAGKPAAVPALIPETDDERRMFDEAQQRYEERKAQRKKQYGG
ncbi:acyl-CoA thioesterase [Paenibacillus alkalitolerans]|uniref:acyl-CoA thioesterase n=1 Tax=Paenibacillus alkalitolerans TaxID=2799335 RepID=UPI0018F79533|nr:acyl-CoA thioesterase [Paenibacillus alkalitolerans]